MRTTEDLKLFNMVMMETKEEIPKRNQFDGESGRIHSVFDVWSFRNNISYSMYIYYLTNATYLNML